MPSPAISQEEFITLFERHGAAGMAKVTGLDVRGINRRRKSIEGRVGRSLVPPDLLRSSKSRVHFERITPQRVSIQVDDGYVFIGSDAHYWPDIVSPAHRAFVKLARKLKPEAVIMNGDMLDGASISRHPPIGWENQPSLIDEIDTVKKRLSEIQKASKAALFWPLGNHDARFEMRLAAKAPEYARVHGVHLQDHFPDWTPCYSVWINNEVVVKHRYKGGVHATHNNTVSSGKTMVTGHLHSAKVTPYDDYNGTRYGVDCGTMADPSGPQFEYAEDNPKNHRQAFCVLRFIDGLLMEPMLVTVVDEGTVQFRQELIKV